MGDEGQEAVSRPCRTLVWTYLRYWIPDLLAHVRMALAFDIYVHVFATQPYDVQTTNLVVHQAPVYIASGPRMCMV